MPDPFSNGTVPPQRNVPRIVLPTLPSTVAAPGSGNPFQGNRPPVSFRSLLTSGQQPTDPRTNPSFWRSSNANYGTQPFRNPGASGLGGDARAGTPMLNPNAGGGLGSTGKPDKWQPYRDMAKRAGIDWSVVVNQYLRPDSGYNFGTSHEGIIKGISEGLEDGKYMEMARRYGVLNDQNADLIMQEHYAYKMGQSSRDPLFTGHPQAVNEWNSMVDTQQQPVIEDKPPEATW